MSALGALASCLAGFLIWTLVVQWRRARVLHCVGQIVASKTSSFADLSPLQELSAFAAANGCEPAQKHLHNLWWPPLGLDKYLDLLIRVCISLNISQDTSNHQGRSSWPTPGIHAPGIRKTWTHIHPEITRAICRLDKITCKCRGRMQDPLQRCVAALVFSRNGVSLNFPPDRI